MAEVYRFFNSAVGDVRTYQAAEFAEYFNRFLSDGLYTENGQVGLQVNVGTGLQISAATGYGFIKGYMYHNDTALTKVIEVADSILQRIDRVVLKFDEVAKTIKITIKKGAFASSPVPPVLINTSTVKELSLAQVKIRVGATNILSTDITDERLTNYCGVVSSLIDIPVQEMWDVWNGTLTSIQTAWNDWFATAQSNNGQRVRSGISEPTPTVSGDIWFKEV